MCMSMHGTTWVKKWSQMPFPKVVDKPPGVTKQVVLGSFELFSTHRDPCMFPKSLEKCHFWTKKGAKGGWKKHFAKSDPGSFGTFKQLVLSYFQLSLNHSCPLDHIGQVS